MVWSPAAGQLPHTVPPSPQNGSRHEDSEADASREPGHLHCWAAPILAASCHSEDHAHLHDRQGICRPSTKATQCVQQMSPSGAGLARRPRGKVGRAPLSTTRLWRLGRPCAEISTAGGRSQVRARLPGPIAGVLGAEADADGPGGRLLSCDSADHAKPGQTETQQQRPGSDSTLRAQAATHSATQCPRHLSAGSSGATTEAPGILMAPGVLEQRPRSQRQTCC